jgi:hypothetical protein
VGRYLSFPSSCWPALLLNPLARVLVSAAGNGPARVAL